MRDFSSLGKGEIVMKSKELVDLTGVSTPRIGWESLMYLKRSALYITPTRPKLRIALDMGYFYLKFVKY